MVTAVGRGFDSRHLHHSRGGGELTGGAYLRVSRAPDARPAFSLSYSVRGLAFHSPPRIFPVVFRHRLWYHLFCEARKMRAKDNLEGTREWLSPRTQSLT